MAQRNGQKQVEEKLVLQANYTNGKKFITG